MAPTTHETVEHRTSVGEHWLTGVLAAVGLLAAGIGLWYAWGPDTGTISIFGWTWSIAAAPTWLAPTLLIGGGAVTMLSMGTESFRDMADRPLWSSGLEMAIALAGLAAIVIGMIVAF
ncbi:MAG: hypothetical protein AB1Z57_05470 [Acidimicrobiia bacterium]